MIEWSGLGKRFGRRVLFAGLDGMLQPGKPLVVCGRNGSGKTTLLRILAGLSRPDAGTVVRTPAGLRISYASPDVDLYAELTGRENLDFLGSITGTSTAGITDLLARAGLTKASDRPVGQYSSGMRQRLKLAASVFCRPDVLLLDEPTLALDEDGISFVETILADHIATGGCVAIATNDRTEVERWADARLDLG